MNAGVPRPALALVEETTGFGYEGPDLTLYLLTCIAVIGGIVVLGWFFRRLLARTVRARAAKRSLQVVDILPLGGKQKLAVVRCYDRSFLLGLGEKEVQAIAELDAETVHEPVAEGAASPETTHPVRSLEEFERVLRRAAGPAAEKQPPVQVPRRPVLEGGRGILG